MSFALPGLGHLYCGRPFRGIVIQLICIASPTVAIMVFVYSESRPYNVIVPCVLLLLGFAFWILTMFNAFRTARAIGPAFERRWFNKWYFYVILFLALVYAESTWFPAYGSYKAYSVPTGVMEDTIINGDKVEADVSAYKTKDPMPGDVVVFKWPGDSVTLYDQRCIAVGGQVVEVRDKRVFVDGIEFAEYPFVKHVDPNVDKRRDNFGPYKVPATTYFMMGDNRDDSYDSRFWGPVPRRFIVGKVLRVYWSRDFDRVGLAVR